MLSMKNSKVLARDDVKTDWSRFAIIVSAGVIAAMQIGKVIVFLAPMQKDFNIDLKSAGWIMSIFAVIGVVFMAFGAALVGRFGDKRLLILGLLGILFGSVCTIFTTEFSVLLILRSFEGFGFLLISVAGPAVIQRIVAAKDKDIAFSLWSCFMPAGIVIAILSGSLFTSWQSYWQMNSAAVLILLLLIVFFIRRKKQSAELETGIGQMWQQIISVFKTPGMPQQFFSFTMYNIQYFAVITFLPALIQQNSDISASLAAALSAAVAGINITGNIAAGTLLKKGFQRWKILLAGSLLMMVAGSLVFFLSNTTALVAMALIFSGVGGLVPACLISGAPGLVKSAEDSTIAVGLMMQGSSLGQVVGPVVLTAVIATFSWSAAGYIVIVAAFVGMFLAWGLKKV